MKELMFMAQESNDEPPRRVTITKEKNNLTARCTCPRGGVGHICRHRLSILSGNGRLVVSDNVADVKRVEAWVVWSDVGVLIARLVEAQKRLQAVRGEAEKSAVAVNEAADEVRTVQRLLVRAINE
ncbi:MAG: SWIM zinc finger family protein [Magnetococcus sp. DMHC-8]